MPKILVADDNSNIQKMVNLALKDKGIEVVGVGHGEAAVRKLPDLMPDLILADVFMPVRNGYEVCEFVKKDERFAHIPVVLLVGAFDPIDQHEVKRVKADGLLKKPFEPIDELMNMVRAMLDKSEQAKAAAAAPPKAPGMHVGETVELTAEEMKKLTSAKPTEMAVPVAPEAEPAEDYAVRPQRLEFGEGEQPVAFEELAEGKIAEVEEEGAEEEEEETEEESDFRPSGFADLEVPSVAAAEAAPPQKEAELEVEAEAPETPQWGGIETPPREPAPDEPPIPVSFPSTSEELEVVREEPTASSYVESGPLPELASSAAEFMEAGAPLAPAVEPEISTLPAAELGVAELEAPAPAPAYEMIPHAEEIPTPEPVSAPAPELSTAIEEISPMAAKAPEPSPVAGYVLPPPIRRPVIEVSDRPVEDFGVPSFEVAAAPAVIEPPAPIVEEPPSHFEEAPARMAAAMAAPAQVAAPPPAAPLEVSEAEFIPAEEHKPALRPMFTGNTDALARPRVDEALVDAIADKVIAKMQGGMLDKITSGVLRPIIEALIAQELDKK